MYVYVGSWNGLGQLGLGDVVDRDVPTCVPGIGQPGSAVAAVAVSCGASHTAAVLGMLSFVLL